MLAIKGAMDNNNNEENYDADPQVGRISDMAGGAAGEITPFNQHVRNEIDRETRELRA